MTEYSRKLGDSVYPLGEGMIYRIEGVVSRKNKKVGVQCDHTVFIWVTWISRRDPKGRTQDREISVVRAFVPTNPGWRKKAIIERRRLKIRTLFKMLSAGYEIIRGRLTFNPKWQRLRTFYEVIGCM